MIVPPPRIEPPVEPFTLDEPGFMAQATETPRAEEEPVDEPTLPRANMDARPDANESQPPAILKSGVIDGMAYTLYTDGSIEAQLPKGLMRFASIDELRNYLEKNS